MNVHHLFTNQTLLALTYIHQTSCILRLSNFFLRLPPFYLLHSWSLRHSPLRKNSQENYVVSRREMAKLDPGPTAKYGNL